MASWKYARQKCFHGTDHFLNNNPKNTYLWKKKNKEKTNYYNIANADADTNMQVSVYLT